MEKKFNLSINLEHFKLELSGQGAEQSLKLLTKLIERLSILNEPFIDQESHLEDFLSEDLLQDKKISKLISTYSQIYRDFRMNKVSIENSRIIELEQGKVSTTLDDLNIRKEIQKLIFRLPKTDISQIILHIKGNITSEETNKIVDVVQQEFPNIDIKKIHTKTNLPSHTIVEGIFFGEFETEME